MLSKLVFIVNAVLIFCSLCVPNPCPQRIKNQNLQQAIQVLRKRVTQALQAKTFSVGGVFIENQSGDILYSERNSVVDLIQPDLYFYRNPTMHGQRRLISWYWENKQRCNLPEPEAITLITSLDPCMMCTGSILASGFNVGTFDLDQYEGVNFDYKGFERFNFWPKVKRSLDKLFGYYAIQEANGRQIPKRGESIKFIDKKSGNQFYKFLHQSFIQSKKSVVELKKVYSFIYPSNLLDISTLDINSQLRRDLKAVDANSLTMKITNLYDASQAQNLKNLLSTLVNEKNRNALAIIDKFGNLLMAQADSFQKSPIDSCIFNIVNKYHEIYFEQINSVQKKNIGSYKGSDPYQYLSSPTDCRFIFLHPPQADDIITLQGLAVMGQILPRNKSDQNLFYLNEKGSFEQLNQLICAYPPLYIEKYRNKFWTKIPQDKKTQFATCSNSYDKSQVNLHGIEYDL